jgi:uncharacterized glyoxalase superfamily protein PhnB
MNALKLPEGHRRLTPYFLVNDAEAFITFLKQAFHAEDREMHRDGTGRVMHAELSIGDSVLMLGQANGEWKSGASMNYLYVVDTDATHKTCLANGCTELYAPRDEEYGMRSSGVKDAFGNTWWLAQPL